MGHRALGIPLFLSRIAIFAVPGNGSSPCAGSQVLLGLAELGGCLAGAKIPLGRDGIDGKED